MLAAMPTKCQQLHAAAAELLRDHIAPRLRAQRAKEQRLLNVLAAGSSRPPQAQQSSKTDLNRSPQPRCYSPSDEALIADVMAAFPTLTREEAIRDLLLFGG